MLGEISQAAGEEQGASQVPVLLVFDTFEEVFYRAQEEFLGLWRMLENAQSAFPRIRIIISGRIQPRASWSSSVKAVELPLATLSAPDAQRLLLNLGVTDPTVAQALVRQLGGSPLTLRLAARVAESEDVTAGIKGVETRRFWIFSVAQSVVQGQLYRRILDHIHEPEVRALAHPGMVLRRVNVAIIRMSLHRYVALAKSIRIGRSPRTTQLQHSMRACKKTPSAQTYTYRETPPAEPRSIPLGRATDTWGNCGNGSCCKRSVVHHSGRTVRHGLRALKFGSARWQS
ncbi:hypothetical protein AOQ71_34365 [Bradyrhizobium manausense]|uniref:Uncharacterized protein n=1 Tax=Bradyrhizobium manausense TaxID=989370 RepID=A0A0R3D580_9BRAD|nr:hypothetical protein AOQ71_34365 [Bradyrhizobium manausense]